MQFYFLPVILAALIQNAAASCVDPGRHYCVRAEVTEIKKRDSGCLVKLRIVKQITVQKNKAKYPKLKKGFMASTPSVTCESMVAGAEFQGLIRNRCNDVMGDELTAPYEFLTPADDPTVDCDKRLIDKKKRK